MVTGSDPAINIGPIATIRARPPFEHGPYYVLFAPYDYSKVQKFLHLMQDNFGWHNQNWHFQSDDKLAEPNTWAINLWFKSHYDATIFALKYWHTI